MTKKKNLSRLFMHEKPMKILVSIKNAGSKCYASTIAKAADCTYSHTVKILDTLKNAGLVLFKKKGRVKYIKLTESGEDISRDFENMRKKFKRIKIEEKKKK